MKFVGRGRISLPQPPCPENSRSTTHLPMALHNQTSPQHVNEQHQEQIQPQIIECRLTLASLAARPSSCTCASLSSLPHLPRASVTLPHPLLQFGHELIEGQPQLPPPRQPFFHFLLFLLRSLSLGLQPFFSPPLLSLVLARTPPPSRDL